MRQHSMLDLKMTCQKIEMHFNFMCSFKLATIVKLIFFCLVYRCLGAQKQLHMVHNWWNFDITTSSSLHYLPDWYGLSICCFYVLGFIFVMRYKLIVFSSFTLSSEWAPKPLIPEELNAAVVMHAHCHLKSMELTVINV